MPYDMFHCSSEYVHTACICYKHKHTHTHTHMHTLHFLLLVVHSYIVECLTAVLPLIFCMVQLVFSEKRQWRKEKLL